MMITRVKLSMIWVCAGGSRFLMMMILRQWEIQQLKKFMLIYKISTTNNLIQIAVVNLKQFSGAHLEYTYNNNLTI